MPVLGVIPARLGSTRLPNKPLQLLAGAPLIVRVVERVRGAGVVDEVVVATDAPAVVEAVGPAGVRAVLTGRHHDTGTSRVAEVAGRPEFRGFDVVVNIQGDEPFIDRAAIAGAVARVRAGDDVGTAAATLDAAWADDPARVKVVTDLAGRALYFSRSRIPFLREPGDATVGLYWQHIGVYACRPDALARWVALPPTAAEQAERLEQLRALQHGMTIGVALLTEPALPGVDTPEDLRRAEARWLAHEVTV
ncbi:MAG: 3-deoxy-manno-octulosonate cytidylyltransferase [Gemmatimonadota bacterium]